MIRAFSSSEASSYLKGETISLEGRIKDKSEFLRKAAVFPYLLLSAKLKSFEQFSLLLSC